MQQVRLGRTGLTVGVAALGCGGKSRLGLSQGASEDHAADVVRAAIDGGVTLIDTAAAYGTEPAVARAIRGRRDRVVISTKASPRRESGSDALIGAAELRRRVQESLRRLDTDYLDIFHLHGVTPGQYPRLRDGLIPALQDLRDAGLIRFPAISETFPNDPRHEMLDMALADDFFDVFMLGFNYMNQTAAQTILSRSKRQDIGTMCMFATRGPLGWPDTAARKLAGLVARGEVDPALLDADDPLGFMTADGAAATLSEAAYRFCRHAPGIDVVITGTGNIDHLRDNLAAINAPPLPQAVTARLERIFADAWSETGEPEKTPA